MLKRKNLIYSLIGLNIILLTGLIFYPLQRTVDAQTCVVVKGIRADQFARMHPVEGNHVRGSGNSVAVCPGSEIRVGCLFSNFDSPGEQLFNYGGDGGPQGCQFHGSESTNWWATALCVPND